MKPRRFVQFFVTVFLCGIVSGAARAQQTVSQQLSILDERLSRLRADVDALQFNQQQVQQQLADIQNQIHDLRRSDSGVSANDVAALDARIRAVDAARENDKKAIIDQLARELANLSGSRASGPSAAASTGTSGGKEHVVQKGETLAIIAKTYGVTVADLVKANSIANPDDIKVGQKLSIPK